MERIDLKQTLKQLYRQSAGAPSIVEVPELPLLTIDGTSSAS
jgi:hypothetical protein